MNSDVEEAQKLYHELHNVIRRWLNEGDALTTYEIIGALEAVKGDVMDNLIKHNRSKDED